MSEIHSFKGKWGTEFVWQGGRSRSYQMDENSNVVETWLVGKAENANNFAIRHYELAAGGVSHLEEHPYDHGLIILHGSGEVLLGEDVSPIAAGDVVYISPDHRHQVRNTGEQPLQFFCIIPAHRPKNGKLVWAEEQIEDQLTTEDQDL